MNDLEKEEVRRELLELREEVKELQKENRRLLEDRRGGGDSNIFGTLFILSIVVFVVAFVIHFGGPLYTAIMPSQDMQDIGDKFAMERYLKDLNPTTNIVMFASGALGAVSWFMKKK